MTPQEEKKAPLEPDGEQHQNESVQGRAAAVNEENGNLPDAAVVSPKEGDAGGDKEEEKEREDDEEEENDDNNVIAADDEDPQPHPHREARGHRHQAGQRNVRARRGGNRRAHNEVVDEDDDDEEDDIHEDEDNDEDEEEENPLAHLPPYVISRVERLKTLNEERDEIMAKYLTERAALEHKFANLVKPIYDERFAILRGERDEDIAAADKVLAGSPSNDNAVDDLIMEDGEEKAKGVPQFWLSAMMQMDTIGELITEDDIDCLEYLENITCTDDEDGKGFTLRFHFAPNPYFHDAVLTKRYEVPNLLLSDEPILKNVVGCSIQWKPDKSLTFRKIKKKQRGKGKNAGQVRTVTKQEEKESFFRWFGPPKMPTASDHLDEEEAEELEELFENDYDVAQAFRCHIVPNAVLWFTGEAAEKEMLEALEAMEMNDS